MQIPLNHLRTLLKQTGIVCVAIACMTNVHAFRPNPFPAETQSAPGNVLLMPSVGAPTGNTPSFTTTGLTPSDVDEGYTLGVAYPGYFDHRKCYQYDTSAEVFTPTSGVSNTTGACPDASHWSGNVLNWLTMSNLDQYRSVMTGGTRDTFSAWGDGDTAGNSARTILIRAFNSDRDSPYFKRLKAEWPGVPASMDQRVAKIGGNGAKVYIRNTAGLQPGTSILQGRLNSPANYNTDPNLSPGLKKCSASVLNGQQCFFVRVEACKAVPATFGSPAVGVEANCTGPYGTAPNTYYKPEGLLQQFAQSIRFGVMAYSFNREIEREGGVLRAPIKSLGATRIGEVGTLNPNREWNNDGTLVSNPSPDDAAATQGAIVNRSGAINFINQFGYFSPYSTLSALGEQYWGALLYFRNQALPMDHYADMDELGVGGFPIVSRPPDPIIHSCQNNFFLGFTDIYNACDNKLPGTQIFDNVGNAICGGDWRRVSGKEPPEQYDSIINVESLLNGPTGINAMESAAGSTAPWVGGGGGANRNQYVVGMAWWANVNDIRPDLGGVQNVTTYFIDPLYKGNEGLGIGAKSVLWGATKYGGFRPELTPGGNSADPNSDPRSWDADNDGVPDTLYAGNHPQQLRQSLTAAMTDIMARVGDTSYSGAAATSAQQTVDTKIIFAGYDSRNWTGNLRACGLTDADNKCLGSSSWTAEAWFTDGSPNQLTHANRKIITSVVESSRFNKSAFQWVDLSTGQKAALDGTDAQGSTRLDYLRGSRAQEGIQFRKRGPALLGDIVDSNVTYVAGPGPAWRGPNFNGHAAYRIATASRPPIAYVGANDGMLHAFDGSNGKELWAYIPGSVYPKLAALTDPAYSHDFLVNATAMVGDTQDSNANDGTTPWSTTVVGGLGGGGKGYFALDITQQVPVDNKDFRNMTEAELATIPKWEFTTAHDADLGYTYYEPSVDSASGRFTQLSKVASPSAASGTWLAILNNGYGSTNGKAVLYLLDIATGNKLAKLYATGAGTGDNGLSSPAPIDTDGDGLVDTVYAGDLRGRMHKFQFAKSDSDGRLVLAKSGDVNGAWQYVGLLFDAGKPITAAPVVRPACTGSTGWLVLFGTGKFNEASDITSRDTNTFYSILDAGDASGLPVTDTSLATITTQTTSTAGVNVRHWDAPALTGKKGWKLHFPVAGERMVSNPVLPPNTGAVLFGTAQPSADICVPETSGYIMAVDICTGADNRLVVPTGTSSVAVGGVQVKSAGLLKISRTYTRTDGSQGVVCNQKGCIGLSVAGAGNLPGGRYSWRRILSR